MKTSIPLDQASAGENLIDTLVSTAFVIMAAINRLGAEKDLSLSLIRVMGILWDRQPRMSELADYLGLEKQTMTGLIARAEKRGLVARAPNKDDGRAMDVFLTPLGRQTFSELRDQGLKTMAPLVQQLSETEQQQLQRLLHKVMTAKDVED
jgi:DNA-binding MarR family transcriptional regulator